MMKAKIHDLCTSAFWATELYFKEYRPNSEVILMILGDRVIFQRVSPKLRRIYNDFG